jgi:Ni/Co efflux regulator RcnB
MKTTRLAILISVAALTFAGQALANCPPGKSCSAPAPAPRPAPQPMARPAPQPAPSRPAMAPQSSGQPRPSMSNRSPTGASHSFTPNSAPSSGHSFTPGRNGGTNSNSATHSFTPARPEAGSRSSSHTAGGDNGHPPSHRFGDGSPSSRLGTENHHSGETHSTAGAPHSERRFGADHHARPVPVRSRSGGKYSYHGREFARFRVSVYRWPIGFSYVRYDVRGFLPRAFWVDRYWIYDYAAYDLAPPPPDQRWVRYGPDLLLIDLGTGEVIDSVPGAFEEDPALADQPDDSAPPPDGN